MSDYTATLAEVIDLLGGREKFEALALSDYPLFNEDYRTHLNDMLIEHYLMREVGDETVYGFCRQLRNKIREQAPVFNGLYQSVQFTYDPVSTMGYEITSIVDGTTQSTGTDSATSKTTGNTTTGAQSRNLEFPNTRLVEERDYATSGNNTKSAADTSQDSQSSTSNQQNGTSKSISTQTGKGYQGDPNALIAEYRQNLLSVDAEVIRMVEPCFMLLWQSGDSFLPISLYDTIFMGGFYGIFR